MKYLFTLFAAVMLLLSYSALGDGIPVDRDTGKITVPYESIKLSESQIEEVDLLGTLTLDSEQWRKLRAINVACPKRFSVIPLTYHDCTCEVPTYAIAISGSEVAITHDQIGSFKSGARHLKFLLSQYDHIRLNIDRRGQFYQDGSLIRFEELLDVLHSTNPKVKEGTKPFFYVKIPIGLSRNSEVFKARLDAVYSTANEKGWKTPDVNN